MTMKMISSTSTINSKYYNIKELNPLQPDYHSSFGMFHVNMASLNKHIDDLRLIISLLEYKFDIIGISEHKIKKGDVPTANVDIPGYETFVIRTNGLFTWWNWFLSKKSNINYTERTDLALNSSGNFESIFIEINFPERKNLIVGCIYRHPTSKISITDFNTKHINPLLQTISDENKQCVLMGGFNIDLLKCDTNNDSNLFLNNLSSIFYLLHMYYNQLDYTLNH